ncbi:MAG TPA: anthranilate phosphoribosyltransferase, partial [Eubacteriaceae bacterium]|nr:anthranilate phosphoribosyltransferase [Eubacteriaceae bacterium]
KRSVPSRCGSADILQDLGVRIDMNPKEAQECLKEAKLAFLFAPTYHPAMKYVMNTRRELRVRTIFNILGPLANPGKVKNQVLGVFDESLTEVFAEVLKELGLKRAMVIHGMDGLDEISISAETKVSELKDGKIKTYRIKPEDFGMVRGRLEDIKGGSAKENAQMLLEVLSGRGEKLRDIVLLNSAAAIYVGGAARTMEEGIKKAAEAMDSGAGFNKLKEFAGYSNSIEIGA